MLKFSFFQTSHSSNKLNLGPILTWLYWAIELGIIAFITASIGRGIAKKEACEYCDTWYEEPEHIGGVSESKEDEVLGSIQHRDFGSIAKILEENPDMPSVELYLHHCRSCGKGSSSLLVSKANFINGKLVFSEVKKATLTQQEMKNLLEERVFLVD